MGIVSYFKAKVGTKFRGHANKRREKRDDGVQTMKISTMKKIGIHISKNPTPQVNEEPMASTSTNESSNNMVAISTSRNNCCTGFWNRLVNMNRFKNEKRQKLPTKNELKKAKLLNDINKKWREIDDESRNDTGQTAVDERVISITPYCANIYFCATIQNAIMFSEDEEEDNEQLEFEGLLENNMDRNNNKVNEKQTNVLRKIINQDLNEPSYTIGCPSITLFKSHIIAYPGEDIVINEDLNQKRKHTNCTFLNHDATANAAEQKIINGCCTGSARLALLKWPIKQEDVFCANQNIVIQTPEIIKNINLGIENSIMVEDIIGYFLREISQLLTSAHIDQTLTLYEEKCSVDEQSSVVISEIKDRDYLNIEYKNTDESIDENIVIFEDVEAVKSILNSVTSENIVQSTENLMYLIQTIEILEKTIYLIFDEVSSNPKNIPEYIYMCFMMRNIEIRYDGGAKTTSFKRQLLIICNKLLQLEMVEKGQINKSISKETYLKFIVEMFHLNLLPPNILLDIVKILLNQKSDEYIENICYILKNSGKKLEKTYNLKKIMDKLRLLTISMSNDTLNELIKLRNNKWIQFDCPIMKQSKLLINSKKGSQIDKININKCNFKKRNKRHDNKNR